MEVGVLKRTGLTLLVVTTLLTGTGCASRVEHRDFQDEQVGLAALQDDNLKRVVLGEEIQGYVSRYALFAEVINTEVLKDLSGFTARYNVYAREPLTYPHTGLSELDTFLMQAHKAAGTVRVGVRLANYIGLRLANLEAAPMETASAVGLEQPEIYRTAPAEQVTQAIQALHERRGQLTMEQKRELARDVIVLAADMVAVGDAVTQARGLIVEGERLKSMVASSAYQSELRSRNAGQLELLPEIQSNLNGALAALKSAHADGLSLQRNARVWKLVLVDSMQ
jgi:hypothetical protein